MLSINTNLSSLIAQRSMTQATNILNQAIERMTTGYKINHAKDNAANYSIATNMTTKINGLMVAEDNASTGLDLITTAEGTLSLIEDKLTRLRALQEQASNGTYGQESLKAINSEANALVDEINRIYSIAEFNGIKLFDGEGSQGGGGNTGGIGGTGGGGTVNGNFVNPIERRDTTGMTAMASVADDVMLAQGQYTIATAEDLQKLSKIANAGLLEDGSEFVMVDDIDMSGVTDWEAIGFITDSDGNIATDPGTGMPESVSLDFDGNGHVIKNLTIEESVEDINKVCFSIFCSLEDSTIKNLALENIDISLDSAIEDCMAVFAPLLFVSQNTDITNCYTTGEISVSSNCASYGITGFIGSLFGGKIENCYSAVDIVNNYDDGGYLGGLISSATGGKLINCEYSGNITVSNLDATGYIIGGLISMVPMGSVTIENSIVSGVLPDLVNNKNCSGVFAGMIDEVNGVIIKDCQYNTANTLGIVGSHYIDRVSITNVTPLTANYSLARAVAPVVVSNPIVAPRDITFQIGLGAGESSRISLDVSFALSGLDELRNIGLDNGDYLTTIDNMLGQVLEKQTQFGAASNRLESALDEISTQYENLISSRSTIRDADIAEVSSTYIQQQILQQASATLLATANQSPAIALQLI